MIETAPTCARCQSPLEVDDLRCAVCGMAAPSTEYRDRPDSQVEVLRCTGCGAAIAYSVRAQAPECAFCGAIVQIERPRDPLEQTRHFLPFTVDRDAAQATFRRWLRSLGWFRPSDLLSTARIESLRALWWVGWSFDAEALISWTADSDVGARKADWAPHAGQSALIFDDIVVSASRGLNDREVAHLARSYTFESATDRPEGAGDNAVVEQFDVQRSAARRMIAAAIDRLARDRLRQGIIPGRRFRNLHAATLVQRLVTGRFAFPAYVMAYRYRERLYRFVVSGQDASCLIGSAPYSTAKILAVVLGGLVALAILAALLCLA